MTLYSFRFSLCDSPFPKVKLVNIAVQVKNTKNDQIPCPLQGNGFSVSTTRVWHKF